MRTLGIALAALMSLSMSELLPAAVYTRPVKIGALTDGWGATWEVVGLRDGLKELGYRKLQPAQLRNRANGCTIGG